MVFNFLIEVLIQLCKTRKLVVCLFVLFQFFNWREELFINQTLKDMKLMQEFAERVLIWILKVFVKSNERKVRKISNIIH